MNPKYAKQFQGKSKQKNSKDNSTNDAKPVKVPHKPLINRTTSK